jgi:hypothetical protein
MRRKLRPCDKRDNVYAKTSVERKYPVALQMVTDQATEADLQPSIFDNLPEYISPDEVTRILPIARSTIYDWVYRPKKYQVPDKLIVKFGRKILIRTTELKKWLVSRGSNQRTNA